MENYLLTVDQLRARRGVKWLRYPADVLPAWVADMDFAVPDAVQEAIEQIASRREYGYGTGHGLRDGENSLAAAFAEHMAARFGWQADPDGVVPVSELIQAMWASIYAFSEPGDGIVIQTPIYPPFLNTTAGTERRLVENRLLDDGTRYVLDVDGLRNVVDDTTRILMLANPHNPTGRVFERAELQALADMALERNLTVISDEIHSDLVYSGHKHIPFASLGPDIAARTITLTSATKGFNIPGLRCALMHFGSQGLKEKFQEKFPERLMGALNVVGIDATIAAWRHGQPWLKSVMTVLEANRDRLTQFLAAEMPGIRYRQPEATYLSWLDCNPLNLPTSPYQFFLDRAKVGLNDGADFGEAGVGCVRLNFGTSPEILDQILNRMAGAIREVALAPA